MQVERGGEGKKKKTKKNRCATFCDMIENVGVLVYIAKGCSSNRYYFLLWSWHRLFLLFSIYHRPLADADEQSAIKVHAARQAFNNAVVQTLQNSL